MEEIKVDEIWKDIEGCPNYQVSNFGRVRSLPRPKTKGGILTQRKNNCGYLKVYFMIEGKGKLVSVHRLVAKAFINNPKNLPQVNHIDGNKENNNVDNLEWCTAKSNSLHRFRELKQEPFRKYKEKQYDYNTKEGRNEYSRDYYQRNKKHILEYGKKWRTKKKEQYNSMKYIVGDE